MLAHSGFHIIIYGMNEWMYITYTSTYLSSDITQQKRCQLLGERDKSSQVIWFFPRCNKIILLAYYYYNCFENGNDYHSSLALYKSIG
jgi:hypothetical protein